MSRKVLKVRDVAQQLGVSPSAVRLYTNNGELECYWTRKGQRYFTQEQVDKFLGVDPVRTTAFYVRSSQGDKKLLDTQIELLTAEFGKPVKVYSDKASGLRENRPGLNKMIEDAKDNVFNCLAVVNKDRLTRFGFKYISDHLETLGVETLVLEEPVATLQDELMQDFMSLIASFSGRFYRLRGYKQQKELLQKAGEIIHEKESR